MVVNWTFSLQRGLSGSDLVLVREAAKDWFSEDPVLSKVDLLWPLVSLNRCDLAEGTVRPSHVVVRRYSVSTWCR